MSAKPKARIIAYESSHEPAVKAMNQRLKVGGSSWGFYDSAKPGWLGDASDVAERRYLLSVDPDGTVHGGIVVKTQVFKVGDTVRALLTWQGPVSEGLVDRAYANIGSKLLMRLRDERLPIIAWGGSEQLAPLILAMGWAHYQTPLLLKFVRPGRIAKGARFLRTSPARRRILDVAAATGAAAIGGWLMTAALRLRHGGWRRPAVAVACAGFDTWADEIWAAARKDYRMIAVRDRASLERVTAAWPGVEVHRVERDGRIIGWAALLVTAMQDDKRFGNLTAGTIVDALSLPGEEAATVAAASRALQRRGVDLIVVNLTHRRWLDACAANGFLRFNGRRGLYMDDAMSELLAAAEATPPYDFHLMPIDGDGPLGL